jgi:hypothetical protein
MQLIADEQPFREGPMVVGTTRSDGKEFVGMASQNYVLVSDFTLDHSAVL